MSKIIIGVHGLENKPPRNLLDKWWKMSIHASLIQIKHPRIRIPFELVYWADLMHSKPLNPQEGDPQNPFYIKEPYYKIDPEENGEAENVENDKLVLNKLQLFFDRLVFDKRWGRWFSFLPEYVIKKYFHDLYLYLKNPEPLPDDINESIRESIRNRLVETLERNQHQKILLIAHSMGSVIAYDVLQNFPDLKIHTLITVGSPLGLPVIINHLITDDVLNSRIKDDLPPTPDSILSRWYNLSDILDKVAVDYNLSDDYNANAQGVLPVDIIVKNQYQSTKGKNPHKIFGYLQTEEMACLIDQFIKTDQPIMWQKFSAKINKILNMLFPKKI